MWRKPWPSNGNCDQARPHTQTNARWACQNPGEAGGGQGQLPGRSNCKGSPGLPCAVTPEGHGRPHPFDELAAVADTHECANQRKSVFAAPESLIPKRRNSALFARGTPHSQQKRQQAGFTSRGRNSDRGDCSGMGKTPRYFLWPLRVAAFLEHYRHPGLLACDRVNLCFVRPVAIERDLEPMFPRAD
jgi:hypothetical protein